MCIQVVVCVCTVWLCLSVCACLYIHICKYAHVYLCGPFVQIKVLVHICFIYLNNAYLYILHTCIRTCSFSTCPSVGTLIYLCYTHAILFHFLLLHTRPPWKPLDPSVPSRASGVAMGPCHQRRSTLPLRRVGFNVSPMANTFDVGFQALFCNHQRQGEVMREHHNLGGSTSHGQLATHFSAAQLARGKVTVLRADSKVYGEDMVCRWQMVDNQGLMMVHKFRTYVINGIQWMLMMLNGGFCIVVAKKHFSAEHRAFCANRWGERSFS